MLLHIIYNINIAHSLTVSTYTGNIYLFSCKYVCLLSDVLNTSLIMYCVQLFSLLKNKTLIIDMCDCLVCVKISDTKPGRKYVATNKYNMLFISYVDQNFVDTNKRLYTLSFLCYLCQQVSSSYILLLLLLLL